MVVVQLIFAMANSDESVVRTRLLLDGDGTGDDRRLNNIAKMVSCVHIWFYSIRLTLLRLTTSIRAPVIVIDFLFIVLNEGIHYIIQLITVS